MIYGVLIDATCVPSLDLLHLVGRAIITRHRSPQDRGAIREVTVGEVTPIPWLGHEVDLSTALHTTTVALMQLEFGLILEVTRHVLHQ